VFNSTAGREARHARHTSSTTSLHPAGTHHSRPASASQRRASGRSGLPRAAASATTTSSWTGNGPSWVSRSGRDRSFTSDASVSLKTRQIRDRERASHNKSSGVNNVRATNARRRSSADPASSAPVNSGKWANLRGQLTKATNDGTPEGHQTYVGMVLGCVACSFRLAVTCGPACCFWCLFCCCVFVVSALASRVRSC